jgi:predicted O-methyltransferase YrrM
LLGADSALERALERSEAAGLPQIAVSPNQGKLLHLLARLMRAETILELGTLGAYSTIWLARALPPGGRVITIEANPEYASVAAANIAAAGLESVVDLRVGDAHQVMPELIHAGAGPIDLVFIDADKKSTPEYFRWALELSREGGLIIVDNVVRGGAILEEGGVDARSVQEGGAALIAGVRGFYELLAEERRDHGERQVSATAIPTVGSKGLDGLALVLVTAPPAA